MSNTHDAADVFHFPLRLIAEARRDFSAAVRGKRNDRARRAHNGWVNVGSARMALDEIAQRSPRLAPRCAEIGESLPPRGATSLQALRAVSR